ncbi:MAG: zinc transport system substrate-binding protein [Fusobacteria bacterium]|nr:MAG: zinc transport system substrate-binding protein [Fusobacteriota bacterium]KAF0229308.1 MAG: zinc transport system substrate-binding [Fusobacteriota bacterium]
MKKRLFGLVVLMIMMILFLSACGEKTDEDSGKLKVAVTIEVQKGLVEAVAGDLAEVTTLVPKGGSPETFEASPQEIEKFRNADIFFAMDLPVENSKNLPSDGEFRTVNLGEAVREVYEDLNFDKDERDHHTWLSPKRVMVMVEKIAEVLIAEDPDNEEVYLTNKTDYLMKLDELDKEISAMLEGKAQRTFLIFHPALGYFADDYDLEMLALEEEGKEADPKRIGELVDFAKSKGIKAVLTTEEISSKQVKAFAEEIDGKVIVVKVLGIDYIGSIKNVAREIAGIL